MRFVWAIVLAVAGGIPSQAAMVAVNNPSFEDDFATAGTFPVLIPNGWTVIDPGGIVDQSNDAVGVLNPTGSTFFPGGAPDGDNVGLIFLGQEIGTTEVGLGQTLGDVLLANTTYTLSVEVGDIDSGVGPPPGNQFFNLEGFPGYRVDLVAGGVVLDSDDNSLSIV
ncbi:MAG: hypothetical protein N2C14_01995, partial [Planctomycetales bacterium]